ncbi:hypothetical protein [Salinibacter ruber]|uniref:hypothetical protein n=1 Tax=Salinibacter ruber TaxID=146919 RepID=UPI0021671927|nr:hypothetical protein [Salinibacter ruber]MCS4201899.1 ribosome modulation factor [Salinibacter ruber]
MVALEPEESFGEARTGEERLSLAPAAPASQWPGCPGRDRIPLRSTSSLEGSRIEEPSLHEELNPYGRPNLREAFDSGWHAFREDQPPPDKCQFDGPEEIEAWLDGYLMAEDHEGR